MPLRQCPRSVAGFGCGASALSEYDTHRSADTIAALQVRCPISQPVCLPANGKSLGYRDIQPTPECRSETAGPCMTGGLIIDRYCFSVEVHAHQNAGKGLYAWEFECHGRPAHNRVCATVCPDRGPRHGRRRVQVRTRAFHRSSYPGVRPIGAFGDRSVPSVIIRCRGGKDTALERSSNEEVPCWRRCG
jgi:hypothetical protein